MNRLRINSVSFAAAAVLILSGCARPFVEIEVPGIIIVEPDLSLIITDPEITVRLRATSSFRSVTRVEIGSITMSFNASENIWEAPVSLNTGLNEIIVTAYDEESIPGVDTLFAFHMPFEFFAFPGRLPTPVGGHTATLTQTGDLVITGGAPSSEEEALGTIQVLPSGAASFHTLSTQLVYPRVGHTATILPDGRLLLLGGASWGSVDTTDDLVEAVEIFDEDTESFTEIAVSGPPIRRMYHTASWRTSPQGPIIDIIGGTGDITYSPSSTLGTRQDLRSFLIRNDTLIALSTAIGPTIAPVQGHTQTSLSFLSRGATGKYLVTGLSSAPEGSPVSLVIDFASVFGIVTEDAPPMWTPRFRHAAERLSHDIVGLFGGIVPGQEGLPGTTEVYFRQIDKFFVIPSVPSHSFSLRYGLTATIIAPNRIILAGGFDENGTASSRTDIFKYTL